MSVSSEESNKEQELVIKKFSNFEEAKKYVKEDLGRRQGPRDPSKNINSDGYYIAKIKKVTKPWTCLELSNPSVYKGASNNKYWFYPCYENLDDKTTLEFWVIHY